MKAPKWLRADVVLAIHDRLLAEHGGRSGLRDQGLLESALSRPKSLFASGKSSVFELAAACACGLVKDHPFVDGNKRTGFMAAFVFLGINGIDFIALESDVVLKTLALVSGELSENEFTMWLKENSQKGGRGGNS